MIEPGKTYKDQWGNEWTILRGYSPSAGRSEPHFLAQSRKVMVIVGPDGKPVGDGNRLYANLQLLTG